MQVFSQRMAARGGCPLPLSYYLQQDVSPVTATPEISSSVDPFTTRIGGRTLHEALRHDDGFPSIVAFLLGGVDVNVRDKNGATPLHIAVARVESNRDEEDGYPLVPDCPNQLIIAFLIDNGADINGRNAAGETPLMIAAATRNIHALRLLLLRGADPLRRDDLGHTILHHAARLPSVLETLHVWIDDLPLRAAQESLLHTVCRQGLDANFAALFFIEQLEMNVNAREGDSSTSITTTANTPTTTTVTATARNTISPPRVDDVGNGSAPYLHNSSSSVAVMINDGYTPLHCAVLSGDPALVRTLLLKGAKADKPDAAGVTPIQLAEECARSMRSTKISFRRFGTLLHSLRKYSTFSKNSNPAKIYAMLKAFNGESSSSRREAILQRDAARETLLWNLNTFNDVILLAEAAVLPHVFIVLCAGITVRFWILSIVLIISLSWCIGFNQKDAKRSNARPLRSAGFFLGYTWVLTFSCIYQERRGQTQITSVIAAILNSLIFTCGVSSVVCALGVMLKSPGTVDSTAAQRLGIYKTIFHSKGVPPEDVQQSIDINCMVKKPLRAQRCRHLGRVVLRFDHYCTWLSSTIGGGNHRVYLWFLIFYTAFLGGWMCRFFLLSSPFGDYTASSSGLITIASSGVKQVLQRFVDIYVTLVLPLFFVFFSFILLQQLVYIGRGVTSYDVSHPSECPWCFLLGSRTYSLFDAGFRENMRGFFLMRENLLASRYRMPEMNARLQRLAKEYQTLQFSPCQPGGHCHSHTHEGHGHFHDDHPAMNQKMQNQEQFVSPLNRGNDNFSAPTISTASTVVAASPEVETAAGRLFQLMVHQNSADVSAGKELQGNFSAADWEQVVTKAQTMFGFFKSTLKRGN
ncbi:Ankyrin repeat-containing domain [Trypanosoma melophagium]|uniref:Ankyrin repeat-containing domain n=1 Tax=Trypanosoma melophagium TaxID=715481 RepID=UPI00351A6A6A|nr:Ankyrin repeat-containing domain [Trypanosoma melophagium]